MGDPFNVHTQSDNHGIFVPAEGRVKIRKSTAHTINIGRRELIGMLKQNGYDIPDRAEVVFVTTDRQEGPAIHELGNKPVDGRVLVTNQNTIKVSWCENE